MSRRTSRLDTLLRVRRIQEEISRGRLAGEVAAERRAQQLLEQAQQVYVARAAECQGAPEMVQEFTAQRHYAGGLAGTVCAAGTSAGAAAQVTVLARHDWSEAAMRMAALERLEERACEVASVQRLADEQRTSEESSSAQHRRGLDSHAQGAGA
jgi:hypothetical protein